ncbi:MAG: hypothetical protein D6694_04950, partial [Gammaproteobacteria bacterium]
AATVHLTAQEIRYVDEVVARQVAKKLGQRTILGVSSAASGLFSAGFQYLNDYNNPYLTGEQKLRRAGISGFVGFGAAIVGGGVGFLYGGPVGLVVGFGLGIAGDLWVSPTIFEHITGDVPKRNLAPLYY